MQCIWILINLSFLLGPFFPNIAAALLISVPGAERVISKSLNSRDAPRRERAVCGTEVGTRASSHSISSSVSPASSSSCPLRFLGGISTSSNSSLSASLWDDSSSPARPSRKALFSATVRVVEALVSKASKSVDFARLDAAEVRLFWSLPFGEDERSRFRGTNGGMAGVLGLHDRFLEVSRPSRMHRDGDVLVYEGREANATS